MSLHDLHADAVDRLLRDIVERREYSFCSALYGRGKGIDALRWEKFLVWTPSKPRALDRARAYATMMWGPPDDLHAFPRNYIVDARRLVAEGRYDPDVTR